MIGHACCETVADAALRFLNARSPITLAIRAGGNERRAV
jgi:hypothetical protein